MCYPRALFGSQNLCLWAGIAIGRLHVAKSRWGVVPESLPLGWHCDGLGGPSGGSGASRPRISASGLALRSNSRALWLMLSCLSQNLCLWAGIAIS